MRVKLKLFECGYCKHPEIMAIKGGSIKACPFPAITALIEHPDAGLILFDTGYSQSFFEQTARLPQAIYRWLLPVTLSDKKALRFALEPLGVRPQDISHVILSHFHADHISGVSDFPKARLWCSGEGWDELSGLRGVRALLKGFIPGLLPPDFSSRVSFFEDRPRYSQATGLGNGYPSFDVLGDGSLVAVSLPGHSEGHFGLMCRLENDETVFLSGDASWSLEAIRNFRPPPVITTGLTGQTTRYRETLKSLNDLFENRTDMQIVPSHCREAKSRYEESSGVRSAGNT